MSSERGLPAQNKCALPGAARRNPAVAGLLPGPWSSVSPAAQQPQAAWRAQGSLMQAPCLVTVRVKVAVVLVRFLLRCSATLALNTALPLEAQRLGPLEEKAAPVVQQFPRQSAQQRAGCAREHGQTGRRARVDGGVGFDRQAARLARLAGTGDAGRAPSSGDRVPSSVGRARSSTSRSSPLGRSSSKLRTASSKLGRSSAKLGGSRSKLGGSRSLLDRSSLQPMKRRSHPDRPIRTPE